MFSLEVTVSKGLTARNAVSFVKKANEFRSQVKVIRGTNIVVDAKSILGVMALGLQKGDKIVLEGKGTDESEAVEALVKLVDGGNIEISKESRQSVSKIQ